MTANREFDIPFADLNIGFAGLAQALGYPSDRAVGRVKQAIEDALALGPLHSRTRAGFVIMEPGQIEIHDESLKCAGVTFHAGATIARQLQGVETMALFLASAGSGIEDLSRSLMAAGEPLKGYVFDTLGSEIAERAADRLMANLSLHVRPRRWGLTNRFSPGYCGWPVADQQHLFTLLPEGFCGVRLTPSSLMVPLKSVSGVIGLGPQAVFAPYPCAECVQADCFKRKT